MVLIKSVRDTLNVYFPIYSFVFPCVLYILISFFFFLGGWVHIVAFIYIFRRWESQLRSGLGGGEGGSCSFPPSTTDGEGVDCMNQFVSEVVFTVRFFVEFVISLEVFLVGGSICIITSTKLKLKLSPGNKCIINWIYILVRDICSG